MQEKRVRDGLARPKVYLFMGFTACSMVLAVAVMMLVPTSRTPSITEAKLAFVDGDYDTAERILRGQQQPECRLLLARVLLESSRLEEASQIFGEILKTNPESFDATIGVAVASERSDRRDIAALYWTKATELKKEDVRAWRGLALCLHSKGDAVGAMAALQQALNLNPNQLDLSNLLTELAVGRQEARRLPVGPGPGSSPGRMDPHVPDPFNGLPQTRGPDPTRNFPGPRQGSVRK